MMIFLITVLVFLIVLGLSLSTLYFMFEAPAQKKRMRLRLASIGHSAGHELTGIERDILQREVYERASFLERLFVWSGIYARLQRFVSQAGSDLPVRFFLMIAAAASLAIFLVGLLISTPWLMTLLLMLAGSASPFLYLAILRHRRFSKFEELFPDSLEFLARAVRAGHAFTTVLEMIGEELPEPVAGEFSITFQQQNMGLPLSECLEQLAERMPVADVRIFVTALQIQRETGGNLAEILDKISEVIRERFKLYRDVKTKTAEGRITLYILTAAPPVTALLMYFLNPAYLDPLFADPIGQNMLIAAAAGVVIGYFVISRITSIRV